MPRTKALALPSDDARAEGVTCRTPERAPGPPHQLTLGTVLLSDGPADTGIQKQELSLKYTWCYIDKKPNRA